MSYSEVKQNFGQSIKVFYDHLKNQSVNYTLMTPVEIASSCTQQPYSGNK